MEKQRENLPPPEEDKLSKKRILPKAQVEYNILTNGEFPEHHWAGVERPAPKKEYKKNVHMDVYRDFNIVSNEYWEGHKEKTDKNLENTKQKLSAVSKAKLNFNPLVCSYYEQEKEQRFQEDLKKKAEEHGKHYLERLPPTLRVRETIVFDQSKPVPEEVMRFDELKKNQKKRYEKRYDLEQEYRDIDIVEQDTNEQKVLNRFHGDKHFEEKYKGFDNFTLANTKDQIQHLSNHAHMKPKMGLWEQIQAGAEEPISDRTVQSRERPVECTIDKVVNVDEMPLYVREVNGVQDHPLHNDNQTDQGTIPIFESYPNHVQAPKIEPTQPLKQTDTNLMMSNPYNAETTSNKKSHGASNYLKNEREFDKNSRSRAKDSQNDRLYNPELAKDMQIYNRDNIQPPNNNKDGEKNQFQKSGSLANGIAGMQTYSRAHSSLSNNSSKLSFASGKSNKSKNSNKLPTIIKHKPMDLYNPPTKGIQNNSHADSKRSQKSIPIYDPS